MEPFLTHTGLECVWGDFPRLRLPEVVSLACLCLFLLFFCGSSPGFLYTVTQALKVPLVRARAPSRPVSLRTASPRTHSLPKSL